ncbi:plasmid replication protein RepC [Bradyrhizobium sp. CCGUVB23]|uniref:plasmid replication protein RepC n=1 Tax=Bradyrhizobium sp. CCGUVB23 TaxID=2949630 RepID=UPI0020B441AC|nr:plasmid replication protein RepC [Bradyrhizobium sp. CCGUVB23]MCP3468636.1 replication initiation protein RepC [Bradyrhizobium sp. CCGUVB23]
MEMLGQKPMAPFGAGNLSLAVVRAQQELKACVPGKFVHKWQVFRHICAVRSQLGVSDRALAVLDALLSFHPEAVLVSGADDLVVYPSNRQLALRAHGVASSTLRRHLATLVKARLVLRRDSPNGKRYARRGASGAIEQAFGFDLGPIVARADEFACLADHVAREQHVLDLLRKQFTLVRRDIAKMIAVGMEEGVDADWSAIHGNFRGLVGNLPRVPSRADLEPLVRELIVLAAAILEILQRHLAQGETATDTRRLDDCVESQPETLSTRQAEGEPNFKTGTSMIPIRFIVEACPDFLDYSSGDIRTTRDMIATARLVRPLLGISQNAWEEACSVMGEGQASTTLAAILQKGDSIKSAGGYLRALTRRASRGQFSIWSMLTALRMCRKREGSRHGIGRN